MWQVVLESDRLGIPVVLMTGDARQMKEVAGGPRPYPLKPFSIAALIDAIDANVASLWQPSRPEPAPARRAKKRAGHIAEWIRLTEEKADAAQPAPHQLGKPVSSPAASMPLSGSLGSTAPRRSAPCRRPRAAVDLQGPPFWGTGEDRRATERRSAITSGIPRLPTAGPPPIALSRPPSRAAVRGPFRPR